MDQALYAKMAAKSKLSLQSLRQGVSKRASRWHVAPEAAQILWAQEMKISAGLALKRLEPHVQDQVRQGVAAPFPAPSGNGGSKAKGAKVRKGTKGGPDATVRAAAAYLLSDSELKRRCAVYFTASHSFDRAFREATTVLDDRLKKLGQVKGKVNPDALVAKMLHPDQAVLIVSDHRDEQQGFFELVKGLMATFRNPTHHSLNDKLTLQDALRFCGFVDAVLGILAKAQVKHPTAGGAAP